MRALRAAEPDSVVTVQEMDTADALDALRGGEVDFALALLLPHVIVLALLGALFYKRLAVSPFWRARSS